MQNAERLTIVLGANFKIDICFFSKTAFTFFKISIIKCFKYDDYNYYNLDVYVYPKWVNISWGGVAHRFLSYSYNKNRFYERKKEEK